MQFDLYVVQRDRYTAGLLRQNSAVVQFGQLHNCTWLPGPRTPTQAAGGVGEHINKINEPFGHAQGPGNARIWEKNTKNRCFDFRYPWNHSLCTSKSQ
jgi:hypothetical protein